MNIAVIGAGAMGSLFAALLAEGGHALWLYEIQPEIVAAIERDGIVIERAGATRVVRVAARSEVTAIPAVALVVVFVKAYHTAAAAGVAARLAGDTGRVLTLQNGMGNAEQLAAQVGVERVFAGTTAHGATLLAPGRIRHAGSGATTLGPWSYGATEGARDIAAAFNAAGIAVTVTADVRAVLWEKLLINAGINAVTALTGIRNGELVELESARQVGTAALLEGMAIARAAGVTVRADLPTLLFRVAMHTAGNRSSMGQDIDRHRPTEIAAINGYLVRLADEFGIRAPVNRTLSNLIATIEATFQR
ncbi:MAG: 2-dehydropantoate 2-reductase [Gammaproteobacteria bacterium]|nr:2-dehydropantoate 2-reductase [Gammaproteobacteria bacterium]